MLIDLNGTFEVFLCPLRFSQDATHDGSVYQNGVISLRAVRDSLVVARQCMFEESLMEQDIAGIEVG